ncbi:MAG: hypothetical protein J6T10_22790 [Methanobrevibacter sp.]|nr:hypothetical protein [Methanobrevibacter sp.]
MRIIVNDILWKIVFVHPSSVQLLNNQGLPTFGVTDNNVKCVFLSNKLKGEFLYKVLCHELCHVYCFSYNIFMSVDDEEHLAQFISEYGKSIISDTDTLLDIMLNHNIAL